MEPHHQMLFSVMNRTLIVCGGLLLCRNTIGIFYRPADRAVVSCKEEVSSTIFWIFGMTQPGHEPRSPGPLPNTLSTNQVVLIIRSSLTICFSLSFTLTIQPYHPSHLTGPVDCTPCPHSADVCNSLLVSQHWCVHKRTWLIDSSLVLQ